MKAAAAAALLATAASASLIKQSQHGAQRVLSGGYEGVRPLADTIAGKKPLEALEEMLAGMTDEAKALWSEIEMLVPNMPNPSEFFSAPKKHTRRPDSHWDHIVRGAEVQEAWVHDAEGDHRKVGGRLEDYNLRAKKVDPAKLGVDKVKQYSGYLDDEANDKHLFYCTYPPRTCYGTCSSG